jgi:hypothetical protein
MASMNRNVDLEEIGNDAPLGLEFLKYQTTFQKVWMVSMIIGGVSLMLVGTFLFKININICILFVFIPLIFGVLFGANYNQDFTVFQYIVHSLKKSSVRFVFNSSESKNGLMKIKEYENTTFNRTDNDEDFDTYYRNVKKRLITFCVVIVCIIAAVVVYKAVKNKEDENLQHHTASVNVVVDDYKDVTLL